MPLTAQTATDDALVSPELVARVRDALASCGRAVVLVPSFAQALCVQRGLAGRGIALGVTVSTPAAWAQERWEVWGDGRRVADGAARDLLAARVLGRACERPGLPLADTEGTAALLADLARVGLPWLLAERTAPEGATEAERALVGLLPALDAELRAHGLVEGCEVMDALPRALAGSGVRVPPVTLVGFPYLSRAERALAEGLAESGDVALLGVGAPARGGGRADELVALLGTLFGPAAEPLGATGAVRVLLPAGPSAAPELVCRAVEGLVGEGCADVVVVARETARAWRELAPRLAARGVSVRAQLSRAVGELEPGRAFLGYARCVARLSELARTWPPATPVPDAPRAGTVRVTLEDMSWWPPRDLSDFLVSEVSHLGAERARRLDAEWRANRLLTPGVLLEQLTSPRVVGAEAAAATRELLRGRLGSAASKLLAPYVDGDAAGAPGASEAVSALGAVLDVARTLKELGVTADPSQPGAAPLSRLVELAEAALRRARVVLRPERSATPSRATVRVLDELSASRLEPASVDALIVLDQTSAEAAVSETDDARTHVLRAWGVEEPPSAMELERARFSALVRAPRRALVLERTLFGADGKGCYPSVMLSEVMACYGLGAEADAEAIARALGERNVRSRPESALGENAAPDGVAPARTGRETPAPAGRIDARERELVSPPPEGMAADDSRPVLSASQIESYLECPYKWFSLRRLRLRDADAGFTGAEMGTFAHRVLEVSRRELTARARERHEGGHALSDLRAAHADALQREDYREEVERLLARAQAEPALRLPGSAPGEGPLDEARAVLAEEFDAHLSHQYQLVGGRRPLPQALVPHLAREHGQLAGLRRDLDTLLDFEAAALAGFEPRFFEWGFGRGAAPKVEYAGVLLTGTVDRIDVDAHGQVAVIDYKHKSDLAFAREYDALDPAREPGSFSLPRRVQSLIYAQVVRRAFPDLTVRAALYLCTKGAHALAGAVDENLADLVFGERGLSSRRAPAVSVPRGETFGRTGAVGMEALLDASEEAIARKMARLLAGDIEASPLDAEACQFCPVLNCERRLRK
ncbi:PD-(D/E)XK nuclease family protein [Olsenella uli]|uniref:PD-(D/E)XK nuclease family protein n=1 Tax=Olsenella uli TaxID=133926 RepID=UPI001958850E|nr:PD-(D/E)XK nuclease family protein [Olsenella uli]MBM6676205.1 PD-(D/E)XK nuclease family protein [Olsenella uli]